MDDPACPFHVVHHHPGRLRLRSAAWEGTDAAQLTTALAATEGVRTVDHNAVTGSILVTYDAARTDVERLVDDVCRASGLVLDDSRVPPDPASTVLRTAARADERVRELTGGHADLRVIVPAALAGGAVASLVWSRHMVAPRWDNLLYWSFSIFLTLHPRREAQTKEEV